MGMPKKGTRRIVILDRAYRWRLSSPSWDRDGWMRSPPRSHTSAMFIQADGVPSSGQICRLSVTYGDDAPVTPEVVEKVIRRCLEAGWDPDGRGPAFDAPGVNVYGLETKASVVRAVMES